MTYEYINDVAEQRRIHALEKSIEVADIGNSPETILSRARKFEAYLRGDEDAEQPKSSVSITVNERKASW
jgi:hypothetical protein